MVAKSFSVSAFQDAFTFAALMLVVDRLRDKEPAEFAPQTAAEEAKAVEGEAAPSWLLWVLLVSFGFSGFASLVYENAWTRALTLVIGSSIYSFTTMLVTWSFCWSERISPLMRRMLMGSSPVVGSS